MDAITRAALATACRYCCTAANDPPEGTPPVIAAAVGAGTYTALGVVAALLAHKHEMDYATLLAEFGIPAHYAPPFNEVIAALNAQPQESMH